MKQEKLFKDFSHNIGYNYRESVNKLQENLEKDNKEKFRIFIFKVANNLHLELFFKICIVSSSIILCMDKYPSTKLQIKILEIMDFIFFLIFTLEIMIKIFALKQKMFFHSFFNYFDVFLLFLCIINYIFEITFGNLLGISDLIHSFKILRIFNLIYFSDSYMSIFIKLLFSTIRKMIYFVFLLALFILVFAFIGMQIFSYKALYVRNYEKPEILYYYLLLFIIIYYYLLLFIIIYYYLLLFIIIYYYLLLFIIIYYYLLLIY